MPLPSKYVLPVFFLVLFAGTIVLGPPLYFALDLIRPGVVPFHRAMDRALLISALAAVGLFWSRISWATLWPLNNDAWKQVLLGLGIAAISMQAMIGAHLALAGFTSAHLSAAAAWGRVLLALVAALLVAPLEETVFRGFLQGELMRGLGWRAGWLLAALIFMLAHFLKVPVELDQQPVHWWSGATALSAAFSQLGHDLYVPENAIKAINLFLVGMVLGGIILRNNSLWLNAGLHGGWIFGLLIFTGFTRPIESKVFNVQWSTAGHVFDSPILMPPPSFFVTHFGTDILCSPATSAVLLLLGFWLWRFYRHPSISPETGPNAP